MRGVRPDLVRILLELESYAACRSSSPPCSGAVMRQVKSEKKLPRVALSHEILCGSD